MSFGSIKKSQKKKKEKNKTNEGLANIPSIFVSGTEPMLPIEALIEYNIIYGIISIKEDI